tara:strand:- start:3366 stop:3773 length:408 start_codon:yes stop_codon:yes gene_type:complete
MFLLNLRPIKLLLLTIIKISNMNNYETVFIMNPVLSEDQIKETVNKFVSFIKTHKGTVNHEENWGLKKLKYTIQKKKTGFYYLLDFVSEGKLINDLEVEFKRDERVIRWQTIKLDKFALEYSIKRRNKLSNNKKA